MVHIQPAAQTLHQQLNKPRVDQVAPEDALLLQCLEKAGAIFHVRTNQPQSLMVPFPPPPLDTAKANKRSTFAAATTSPARL